MDFDLLCNGDYREENKQRINLSQRAYQVLLNDSLIFMPREAGAQSEKAVSSHLINHIFMNFQTSAEASPAQAMERRKIELEEALSSLEKSQRDAAISLLLKSYRETLDEKIKQLCSEKGHALSIRIRTDTMDFLASPIGLSEGNCYHRIFGSYGIGRYLKAVIEEYTALPFIRREEVYYRQMFSDVRQAIANKTVLNVTAVKNRTAFHFTPLAIMQDTAGLYNYFVGAARWEKDASWRPMCIRATSIVRYRTTGASHSISAAERKQIREAIRKYGVQFLSASAAHDPITVRLSPEGERMYRTMLHQRPLYVKKDGNIYQFDCTEFQAKVYFFRFGKDAVILSPQSLAEDFQENYRLASENYSG